MATQLEIAPSASPKPAEQHPATQEKLSIRSQLRGTFKWEQVKEDIKHGKGIGERFTRFNIWKNKFMPANQDQLQPHVRAAGNEKGRKVRFLVRAGLTAGAAVLAACGVESMRNATPAVVPGGTPEAVPTVPVQNNNEPFTDNDLRVETVLIPLVEQQLAGIQTGEPFFSIQLTTKDLPNLLDRSSTEEQNGATRKIYDSILRGIEDELGKQLMAAHPEIASVEGVLSITSNGAPNPEDAVIFITPYLRATTRTGAVDLYYVYRVMAGDHGYVEASPNHEPNLTKVMQVTVAIPGRGNAEVWYDEKGVVTTYINPEGQKWENPLSVSPTYLGGAESRPNILDEVRGWISDFGVQSAEAADLITPQNYFEQLGLDVSRTVTHPEGWIYQLDSANNILVQYNPETLTHEIVSPETPKNILVGLGYTVDPNERYEYAMDDQDVPSVWHAGGELDIAEYVDGGWRIVETAEELAEYQIAKIVAALGLPADGAYAWVDESQSAIKNEAGTTVAEINENGEWVQAVERIIMSAFNIEIEGRSVEYTMEVEGGEADIRPDWKKLGVEALRVNPNLQEADKKIGHVLEVLFYNASEAGYTFKKDEGFEVSFDEFKENTDAYPIGSLAGAGTFKLSEVTKIKQVFLKYGDPRLRGTWGGYAFENGVLTVYSTTILEGNDSLILFMTGGYGDYSPYAGSGLEQMSADRLQTLPFQILILSNDSEMARRQRRELIIELSNYYDFQLQEPNETIAFRNFLNKGFWYADLTEGFLPR